MRLCDQAAQIEAQPETAGISLSGAVGAIEGFANMCQVFCRYTLAVVFHFQVGKFTIEANTNNYRVALAMAYGVVD